MLVLLYHILNAVARVEDEQQLLALDAPPTLITLDPASRLDMMNRQSNHVRHHSTKVEVVTCMQSAMHAVKSLEPATEVMCSDLSQNECCRLARTVMYCKL